MNDAILVDTDVIVDYMRGYPEAAVFVRSLGARAHVSVITIAELYAGAREAEMKTLERVLSTFEQLAVTPRIAVRGGRLSNQFRRSHGLQLGDILIAATAQEHSIELATLNVKHFPMLSVKRPYVKT